MVNEVTFDLQRFREWKRSLIYNVFLPGSKKKYQKWFENVLNSNFQLNFLTLEQPWAYEIFLRHLQLRRWQFPHWLPLPRRPLTAIDRRVGYPYTICRPLALCLWMSIHDAFPENGYIVNIVRIIFARCLSTTTLLMYSSIEGRWLIHDTRYIERYIDT